MDKKLWPRDPGELSHRGWGYVSRRRGSEYGYARRSVDNFYTLNGFGGGDHTLR
jgi:hypothetical protein